VAQAHATSRGIHVVQNGHRTHDVSPDGRTAINRTGNPGMATGGTGDVLTGVISAWLAQLLDAEAATRVGVYLHGRAGDLAVRAVGGPALVAGDVLRFLGSAWLDLAGESDDDD
jgi:NAD(P)H-hydrate epimerase